MFKSIQPLCHRYLLLLCVSLCVLITAACSEEDTACDDESTTCAAPSVNNTPNETTLNNPPSENNPSSENNTPNETTLNNPPSENNPSSENNPPNETTLPNPPAGEVNLVCGQIVRELDHPGAYNEPITFSNTALATLVLLTSDTLDRVEFTTQSGPFQLPLDYCITGPASLLDTDDTYVVFGLVNQDRNNIFKIGDLFLSQRIHEEDSDAIYDVTLPQYDAVTPLAGLEDCTADNSQFDCLIACDHPDLALYSSCENSCTNNPLLVHCLVDQPLP